MNKILLFCTLTLILLVFSSPFILSAEQQPDLKDAIKTIDSLMQEIYRPDTPGAVIVITDKGKVQFKKAYGLADAVLNVEMDTKYKFPIGSMTKQFTAIGILKLIEDGKLSLETDIIKYFPDFKLKEKSIKIKHLLAHTSGIIDFANIPKWMSVYKDDCPPDKLIGLFKDIPLLFEPGTDSEYSSSTYVMLARIIEKISGKSYSDFIKEEIFDKAGMKNSSMLQEAKLVPGMATGHAFTTGGFEKPFYVHTSHYYGSGNIISNADDLVKYNNALVKGKIISSKLLKSAYKPYRLNNGKHSDWGYASYFREDYMTIDTDGGIPGYMSGSMYLIDKDIYILILTNVSNFTPARNSFNPIRQLVRFTNIIRGDNLAISDSIKIEKRDLEKYKGKYKISNNKNSFRIVTLENNQLFVEVTGGVKRAIYPLSKTEFFYENSGKSRYIFTIGDDVKVKALTHVNGKRIRSDSVKVIKSMKNQNQDQFIKLPQNVLKKYEGKYLMGKDIIFNVKVDEHCISISAPNFGDSQFCPSSRTIFKMKNNSGVYIRFVLDEHQNVKELRIPEKRVDMILTKITN